MADVDGSEYPLEPVFHGTFGNVVPGSFYGVDATPPPITYYKMRGVDQTCPAVQQPAYVYWVVETAPDTGAAQATLGDLIFGTDPLTDIVEIEVAHRWTE